MKVSESYRSARTFLLAAAAVLTMGVAYMGLQPTESYAQGETSLLGGKVTTASGEALAGIPVRAHRDSSNITVTVYTNSQGEYFYPGWSDVTPGTYSVSVEEPDFEPVKQQGVALATGKPQKVDFKVTSRKPPKEMLRTTDILRGLPGTEEQKFLFSQCSNCHSLQWALQRGRTKEEWLRVVKRMAGARRTNEVAPGSRAFDQKPYLEPVADYLTSIRGPNSTAEIPYNLRPRPTSEASTRLVVTEYDVPRGGSFNLYRVRGDRTVAWPHDIVIHPNRDYAYYTDHFSYNLGRLNLKTGAVDELPFEIPKGAGRDAMAMPAGQGRAGNPGGGAHDIKIDRQGNVVIGAGGAIIKYDPKTEKFQTWAPGDAMIGLPPDGNVWYMDQSVHMLDVSTGERKEWKAPPHMGVYDVESDSQGRFIYNGWRDGRMGVFDPKTEKFRQFPVPTPGAGPRRGDVDAQDRAWVGLYWAGRLARFDPTNGEIKEFPLVPDSKPFGPPFAAPYSAAVDNKNQIAWTHDFNSSRIYKIDMKTGQPTEYYMPLPYEIRDLTADEGAERPTVWIPTYRAPAKMVKVQLY
jgi:streptogramin lyase